MCKPCDMLRAKTRYGDINRAIRHRRYTRLSDAAFKAYEECGIVLLLDDIGEGKVIRCAITNAPILETDETAIVLKAALP